VQAVTTNAPLAAQPLVSALAVASLPVTLDPSSGLPEARYVASLVARVREVSITREIADSLSLIRRLSSDPDADPAQVRAVSMRLQDRQRALADLRERVS
jgi:DNA primase